MYNKLILLIIILCCSIVRAEEFIPSKPKEISWPFDGIFGKFDRKSIQRGFKVYREVCSACHSLKRIAFRNLQEIGFSAQEVKDIAASYQIKDGPNDTGEMFERAGKPSDYFVPPFPNKQAAAASNNGAVPPDLSLIIKARANGANYLYSLLTGYDNKTYGTLYGNPYFLLVK